MAWLVYSHRGVAKRLVLDIEPEGAVAGAPFTTQPVGHLVDGSGLPARTAGVTVTAAKAGGPGTLGGTLTAVTDEEGIFAFTDLELDTVATDMTLSFSATGLVAVGSAEFDVTGVGSTYSLTAEAAAWAWTGAAATCRYGRRLSAEAAGYTWSVAAATLRSSRRLTAAAQSYTWSGTAATLTYSGGGYPPPPTLNGYFNSTEAGGDGSDANVILADDFARGWWFRKDADHCGYGTGPSGQGSEGGWYGGIYYGVDGSGNVGDGGAIAADAAIFSEYAAYMGNVTSGSNGYMAEHKLASSVDEMWIRYYHKFGSGYTFGAEKTLVTLNKSVGGGIYFGNVHMNVGAGSTSSTGSLQFQPSGASQGAGEGNQSLGITFSGNDHWYCVILHVKLGSGNLTADGVLECWADDCGTDGVSGPGSPTLRFSRSNYHWPKLSGDHFGALWFENWSNPESRGRSWFKNVMVRTDHSPGFRTA